MASREAERAYLSRIVAGTALFRDASADDLAEIVRSARLVAVERGKAPPKGRDGDVYVIETGALALLARQPGVERAILLALYGPKDVAGLQSRTGDLKALSNVTLVALPLPDLERVRRRSPEISEAVVVGLADETGRLAARFATSLQSPLELRLASLFAELAEIATGNKWDPTVNIGHLQQTQIADMLGVSREHVNRTLIMWEKSGLIFQSKAGEIVIENRKRLLQIAQSRRAAAPGESEFHAEIEAHLNHGLNEAAFDLAMENIKRTPKDDRFKYLAVLAMARIGALNEALSLADSFRLSTDSANEDSGSIGPRLRRDLAFAKGGVPDKESLALAARGYEKVFEALNATYPGVNAAATYAMSGDLSRARTIAAKVRGLASAALADIDDDEPSYWRRATLAECRLIEGDLSGAARDFSAAVNAADAAPGKIGTTRKQLRRLKSCLPIDDAWIDRAAPQAGVLYYCGPLVPADDRAGEQLERLKTRFAAFLKRRKFAAAVGALAAGADIVLAETLLDAGVDLYVHLPLAPGEFIGSSVAPAGENWRARYIACVERAQTVDWTRRTGPSRGAYRLGARIAMGRAIRLAEELASEPTGFFAVQAGRTRGNSVSCENAEIWKELGHAAEIVEDAWPPTAFKTKAVDAADYLAALIVQGPASAATKPAPLFSTNSGEMTVSAYFTPREALAAAADAATKDRRLWLDIGIAANDARKRADFREALVAAACRPQTPTGKIFATESFANAATATPGVAARFEYVGVTSTEEKLDPCPLFLVDP